MPAAKTTLIRTLTATGAFLMASTMAFGHGDVAPQAVDTSKLPALDNGDDWAFENPYRDMGMDVYLTAIEIGESGYTQNCARCHGLEAISGGLAPDLRFLEAEEFGDEWWAERFKNGYTQNGITKMPAFGDLLGEEAAWAIRTYVETRPDDQQVAEVTPELKEIQAGLESGGLEPAAAQAQLEEIAGEIETMSGAELADSVAYRAAKVLENDPAAVPRAVEVLTVGLSAAQ